MSIGFRLTTVAVMAAVVSFALAAGPASSGGSGGHNHNHAKLSEVPSDAPAPTITLEAFPDPADGYNLHLAVENFTFSPQHIGQDTGKVEGHAHLYVNGTKIGRLYGTWTHLPAKLLEPGSNEVRVSLNTNTHLAWALGDAPLEASLDLSGPEAEPAAVSQDIDTINVVISETSKAYSIGVKRGTLVKLSVSGAAAKDLHLHGYDVDFIGAPGQPARATFDAAHTGRYALKMHVTDNLLGQSERAVLYIEVRE